MPHSIKVAAAQLRVFAALFPEGSVNVKDAIYQTVRDFPGGAEALAPRLGAKLSARSLRNMADPHQETHGWSLRRFDMLLAVADKRPLEALCQQHGGIFLPLGEQIDGAPAPLLKRLHKLASEFSDLPRAIEAALKRDGQISDNELKRIEREGAELVSAVAAVLGMARQIHDSHQSVALEQRP